MLPDVLEYGRKRRDPCTSSDTDVVGDRGPHRDLAFVSETYRPDPKLLPGPTRCLNVGSALDRNVVADCDEIKRPRKICIPRALEVLADPRSELLEHKGAQRRAAVQSIEGQK